MKFRRRPEIVRAIQYIETSRRPGRFADIVQRNGEQVGDFLGAAMFHESTFPNGHPEGRAVLIYRPNPDVPAVEIGITEWVVWSESSGFQVYGAEQFAELFEPL